MLSPLQFARRRHFVRKGNDDRNSCARWFAFFLDEMYERNGLVMTGGNEHEGAVTTWFERAAQDRSVESQIQAFEATFAALWQRSHLTLGDVTLTAIVERVIHTATGQYPLLTSVEVSASGVSCRILRSQAGLRQDQVSAAIRFVLVEFLTVLGNLTAQILTPVLHAELLKGHTVEDPAP
jgi:hypothetical protein